MDTSLIHETELIRKILNHLGLWKEDHGNIADDVRGSPTPAIFDPLGDGWPGYQEPTLSVH